MTVGLIDPRRANTPFYIGASTDTKPTPPSPNAGARFYETDSGVWYIYTGTEWVELRDPEQGLIVADPLPAEATSLADIHLELIRIRRLLETTSELDSDDLDLVP